jgi:hypothetical protein
MYNFTLTTSFSKSRGQNQIIVDVEVYGEYKIWKGKAEAKRKKRHKEF